MNSKLIKFLVFFILITLIFNFGFLRKEINANGPITVNLKFGSKYATLSKAQGTTEKYFTGNGSWKFTANPNKFEFYIAPDPFLGEITIDAINTITFHTNKPLPTDGNNPYNFYLVIYTKKDGVDDKGSWYGYKLISEPYFSENLNAPADTWITWTTDSGTNHLRFFDPDTTGSYGSYTDPFLNNIQSGAINWHDYNSSYPETNIDYGPEKILYFSFQTATIWSNSFNGYLDAITITLTNGDTLNIDLEDTPDEVWVDDDWAGSTPGEEVAPGKFYDYNAFATIQDGINGVANSGTVYVYPGNYQEQLVINKSINLEGIVENGNKPIIKPPNNVSKFKFPESSAWWEPVIIAFGGSVDGSGNISGTSTVDVSIKNFEIDGNNRKPSTGTRSAGILFRNVKPNDTNTSKISNNIVKNMYIDGAETFGIIVYGDSDLVIEYNNVSGYSRGGVSANGDSIISDPQYPTPHSIIQHNTVTGPGMGIPVTWAPNGIQIGWGATGKILNNNVSGNGWPGSDWTGSGIIVAGADNLEVAYNEVKGNETGITVCGWMWNPNGVTADSTYIHDNNVLNNSYGISIQDKSNNTKIERNTIQNNKYDGIDICNFYGYYPKNTIIEDNDISNNNTENDNTCGGIWIDEGIPSNEISINYNIISGNNNYGILNTSTTYVVNAKYNWWGDESGPSGAGPGSGDAITSNVDYSPWLVPNISVAKSDSPDPVAQGMPLTYTLNWSMGTNWATWNGTNIGTTTVPVPTGLTFGNVVLKDTLPSQVTYVSCTGGGVYSSGVVTWNLGSYNPGTSGFVTVNVNVNLNAPDSVITNTAEISYDTLKVADIEDTTIQEGAGGVYNFFDTRTGAYILLNTGSSGWRVIIPSRNYDTGWMPFRRFTSSRNHFWGEYADTRYHFIIDFTYPNRYHIIFNDRLTRISIKIAN